MGRQTIRKILTADPSGFVNDTYRISDAAVMQTKSGKDFLRCKLSDKTGTIPAVCWDLTEGIRGLSKTDGAIVQVTMEISAYQGAHQAKISGLAPASDYKQEDFERRTAYSVEEMWVKLVDLVGSMESVHVRGVAEELLINAGYSDAFKMSPAATGMHHAFVGGLLEHTWQMVETGDTLLKLPYYGQVLNRDLCLFGLVFHDFGKIFEYKQDGTFQRTVQGRLVPHIPMVAAMIYESANKFGVPEVIRDHLMHVVLAHHGKVEWGSPVSMNVPEAAFVHYIDNLHGTVFGWIQRLEQEGAGREIVKVPFGGNELLVERFDAILKKCAGAVASFDEADLPF